MPPLDPKFAADLRATAAELRLPRRSDDARVAIPPTLTLENLRELEWKRFEELAAYFFSAQGWKADFGTLGPDGGVDVRLTHRQDPARRAHVQCKAWTDQQLVGVKPVRELFGVMAADGVPEGWFLTTSDFTAEARAFATGKTLHLLSGPQFVQQFNQLPGADQRRTLDHVLRGDYRTPTCATCGTKMVFRDGDVPFWGCRHFPRCRGKTITARRVAAAGS